MSMAIMQLQRERCIVNSGTTTFDYADPAARWQQEKDPRIPEGVPGSFSGRTPIKNETAFLTQKADVLLSQGAHHGLALLCLKSGWPGECDH